MNRQILLLLPYVVLLTLCGCTATSSYEQLISDANTAVGAGRSDEAIELLEAAVKAAEKFGPDDKRVAESSRVLAVFYEKNGNYAEAERLFVRALAVDEKVYGRESAEVITDCRNLALVYQDESKFDKAEQLLKRALAIALHEPKSDKKLIAGLLNEMSYFYYRRSGTTDPTELDLEQFCKRSLAAAEEAYGADQPDTIHSYNVLALVCVNKKKYADAETYFKRALKIAESSPTKDQYVYPSLLDNLGSLYVDQGEDEKGRPYIAKALQLREQYLGPKHPQVVNSLGHMAELDKSDKRFEDAATRYQRCLEIDEKVFGAEHIEVARDLHNLADCYYSLKDWDAGAPLEVRAAKIYEKNLGPNSNDTVGSLSEAALMYKNGGKYQEAEKLYAQVIERDTDPIHKSYQLTYWAAACSAMEKHADAEKLLKQSLALLEQDPKSKKEDWASTASSLSNVYLDEKKYAEAEALHKKIQATLKQSVGVNSRWYAKELNNYGQLFRWQNKFGQADPLFKQSLAIGERVLDSNDPIIGKALQSLAESYTAQKKQLPEAEKMFARAIKIFDANGETALADNCRQRLSLLKEETSAK